jgi:hypothetical protein
MSDEIEDKTIDELIALALSSYSNEERYEEFLGKLRSRATLEMFNKAKALSFCEEPNRRILGAQILCQLGYGKRKFVKQSCKILLPMLTSEENPGVIAAIAWGLHHLKAKGREAPLIRLKNHPDAEVRLGVVGGLLGLTMKPAVQTLIELSRDVDHNVRNWATFGLGSQISADSPEIRQALYDRLSDEDEETHLEAIWGLSQRKDIRVIDSLVKRLLSDTVGFDDLIAAEALSAPELLPALISLRDWEFEGDNHLETAIRICESNQ